MVNGNNLISPQDKEVRGDSLMRDVTGEKVHEMEEEVGFKELYEQSRQDVQFGEIVMGKVVQINSEVVMVDVGWKTEGYIPVSELKDKETAVAVGDEIEVLVDRKDGDGNLILSRDKAAKIKVWDDIKNICEHNTTIEGTVVERVKGGFSVDIGVLAFLPGSQVDIRPMRDLDKYVGQTLMFNILKCDRKRNNVVLSRRSILEQEREAQKRDALERIEVGEIMEGVIKNITDYGLFIDLGGIDGLLHVSDISWGRITRPPNNFSRGDKINVKILSFDREKERVSLGLKQLTENPWATITERYPVGSILEGKVVNLTNYGVFVELEPGVEGLIHISEMFWTREIKHPAKFLSLGEIIKVMILEVDPNTRRISLGLKQTTPNPWENLKQKYPEGTIVKGVIKNIASFGIFVGIEDGIDGLVHISDISWKHRVKHPSDFFQKGQEIEAIVLNVDVEREKFSLGIKQIENDPWEELSLKYTPASVVTGKVTNITDFGVFVEIEEGIEGLVHVSELSQKRVKSTSELFAVGDSISAVVKSIDAKNRKIRLSIKDYESSSERHSNRYINNTENVGYNLGEALADVKISSTKG